MDPQDAAQPIPGTNPRPKATEPWAVADRFVDPLVASLQGGLHQVMAEVQAAIGSMEADEKANLGSYSYSYIGKGAIFAKVRELLASRGVATYVSVEGDHREGNVTTVWGQVTFYHGASGEAFSIGMRGQGSDPGDKGLSKAVTSAIRVALTNQFLQGGDVDAEQVDTTTKPAQARAVGGDTVSEGQVKLFFGKANGAGLTGSDGKVDENLLRRVIRWRTDGVSHFDKVLRRDVDSVLNAIDRTGANRVAAILAITAWEAEQGFTDDVAADDLDQDIPF